MVEATVSLTALEKKVLDACWEAALASTGGDFACLDEVSVPGLGRKALGGVMTSLEKKRALAMDEHVVNQTFTRLGRRTGGTRIVQVTFSDAFKAARRNA